jgi:UDP-N-acetylglucosamine 2-epimerase (non-hydrolysing)
MTTMTPLKIFAVFGTRPEAIKMAPLCRALKADSSFELQVLLTAQHRKMLDQVMDLFRIPPDHDLNIMQDNQTLEHVVTQVLTRLGPLLEKERPDLVLVHGDTVTTFAAALSAFYHKVPVGHVEAGLRSYDMENPFPEESNRVLADHLCALHFAPTHAALKNLRRENISAKGIFVTGNTVIDALKIATAQPHDWKEPALANLFKASEDSSSPAASGGGSIMAAKGRDGFPPTIRGNDGRRLILLTAHRRENHGAPLEQVFRGLRRVIDEESDTTMIYPVHLNPKVQKPAKEILSGHPRIHLIPPVDYLDLVNLMKRATLVVTDSGGIQEEAPALGKPVLVLRKVTERPEAVKAGTARVIGVEEERVYRSVRELLTRPSLYRRMANAVNPYGDGKATARILESIQFYFGRRPRRPAEFRGDL